MKSQITHLVWKRLLFIALIAFFAIQTQNASATHFRYGNISWQKVAGNPYKIKFKVTAAFRTDTYVGHANFTVGSVITNAAVFNPGQGSNISFPFTITSINYKEGYIYGEWNYTHTYPSTNANYEAKIINCCRVTNLKNNAGERVWVKSNVQVGTNTDNNSPVSTVQAIVNFPRNEANATFQIPSIDPDDDGVTFSLSPNGSFGDPSFGNLSVQPTGLSVSSTGLLTWNTIGKNTGDIYNTSVKITDSRGAYVTVDFILQVVGASIPSVYDYNTTPPNGTVFDIQPGDTISFQMKVSDPNTGDTVSLSALGLPSAVIIGNDTLGKPTFTTSGTNPVVGDFSWKPHPDQQGIYVVSFISQDDSGVQTTTIIYFDVSYKPRFDFGNISNPITPGNNSLFNVKPGDVVAHPVKAYHPVLTDMVNLTVQSGLATGMTFNSPMPLSLSNPVQTNFSWMPTQNQWGVHKLVFKATDTLYGQSAYDTIYYAVDNPPVITSTPTVYAYVGSLYNYILTATDLDIPNGDKLKIENITKPAFLNVTANPGDTVFNIAGIPSISDIGTHPIDIELADSLNHYRGSHVGNDMQFYNLVVLPELEVSGIVSHVTINGLNNGAINITSVGGKGPYTYQWSNSSTTEDLTGITAGIYYVTVTDSVGMTVSDTFVVNQPAPLVVPGNVTHVTINGQSTGAVDITPAGGVGSYTYSWSNSATTEDLAGVLAGSYTVTVTDANGATKSATFVVNQPAPLTVPGSVTNVTINGLSNGAVNITATGGVGPYTYSWSNSATTEDLTGLAAGSYTVTVTDANGATAQNTFVVNQPAVLTVSGTVTNVTINGQSNGAINITPTGGVGPYTYSWSNSATTEDLTGQPAGTYIVIVTDANGATATDTFVINQPPALAISGTVTNVSTFGGNNGSINITVTGGVGPYTYSWSNNTTAEDPTGLVAGTYSVTVTDANGATKTASYTVTQPSAPQFPMVSTCTFPYVITLESVKLVNGKYEWIWSVRNPNPGNGQNGTVQDLSHWNITLGNCASFNSITSAATSSNGTSWTSFTPTYKADPSIGNGVKVVKFDVGTNGSAKKYYKIVTTQNLSVNTQSIAYYKSGNKTGSGTICFPGFGCQLGQGQCNMNVSIAVNPNPTVSGQAQNTIFLGYGPQSVTLTANPSNGSGTYSYSWYPTSGLSSSTSKTPTASPSSTKTYTVTVTDGNGCTKSQSVTINVKDVEASCNKIYVCKNGNTKKVSASQVASYLNNGYTLGECDDNGCDNKGIDENVVAAELKLYPNPTTGIFAVELPEPVKGGEALILDMSGKLIQRVQFLPDTKLSFDLGYAPKGTYMIQIANGREIYKVKVSVN